MRGGGGVTCVTFSFFRGHNPNKRESCVSATDDVTKHLDYRDMLEGKNTYSCIHKETREPGKICAVSENLIDVLP